MKNLAIYVHYPFCKSKCPYCDFNSHVTKKVDYNRYIAAYERELDFFFQNTAPSIITSIFFGGGTPSLMPTEMVQRILAKIKSLWPLDNNCEISMEVNPTSFEAKKFEGFKAAGVNRLSLGIQALNDDDLKFLGRNHSAAEAMMAIKQVKQIYDNFSFDLIYARPQQKLSDWLNEIEQALNFESPHLSLYQLTIEKGTPFFKDFKERKFSLPSDNKSADFYQKTNEFMQQSGFINYEISNYSKPNFACRHNLSYWQGDDYIGIGAGAHSRIYFKNKKQRQALMMIHKPQSWLEKVEKLGWGLQKKVLLTKKEVLEELILSSLRTDAGLTKEVLLKHFDKKNKINDLIDLSKIEFLHDKNIIFIADAALKISQESRIISNEVIAKICSAIKI